MSIIQKAWSNFKIQPEIWFFYGFLLTSMLSVRKVLADYFIVAAFNEYTGVYIYLSDLFLVATLIIWLISILYNKNIILSMYRSFAIPPRRECATPASTRGECSSTRLDSARLARSGWNILRGRRGTIATLLGLPMLLVLWSFITISWSSQPEIAIFRSFKLFEFYLLYLFLVLNPKCSTWNILKTSFQIIIFIGVINSLFGIFQFALQHSIGLFWLKESLILPDLPGVAKIVLGGAKYIRAYGFFPHPNILGGFLLLSILLTLIYRKMFHPNTNVPPQHECSTWNILQGRRGASAGAGVEQFRFLRDGTFIPMILGIQIVGLILTFSKSAILGLVSALVYIYRHRIAKVFYPSQNVPPQHECSTWNILRGRHGTSYGASGVHFSFLRSGVLKKAFLMAIIFGLGIYLIHPDFDSIFMKSLAERLVYINISLNMISGNFLAGIGSGQFVLEMQKYSLQVLQDWQLQPVHNVFLLIWTELGLVGLSLFSWLIWKLFHFSTAVPRLPRETKMFPVEHFSFLRGGTFKENNGLQVLFKALLIGFFVIALFDHYLWDIQQGQIMLWLVLGLLARNEITKSTSIT